MKCAPVLLTAACLLTTALAVQPEFDAREVARRMRNAASPAFCGWCQSVDDGEFLVDTSIRRAVAPGYRRSPAIAWDGADFLAVWEDIRSGSYDIYAMRLTPDGVALDPSDIPISVAANDQRSPALAFDGENFLVVWAQYSSGSWAMYGARLTPDGVVLDPAGISISTATSSQSFPAVAFDGTNFLVVWGQSHGPYTYDIYGARVTPGGVVLDPAGIAISTETMDQYRPALSFDGENFLVAWYDSRNGAGDVYGARVTPAGVVLDHSGIPISIAAGSQFYPALAFDGENFLVVWGDGRGPSPDIYGARVTPAGVVLDPSGIAVSPTADDQYRPALAFDGENFLVVRVDTSSGWCDIYGSRVTSDGVVLDTSRGIAISTSSGHQLSPALAFDNTNFLVVWEDLRSAPFSGIYGAPVTPGGVVLDSSGIAVSTATNSQWSPAIAFDGTNFLAVWEDSRSGSYNIYGARVTPDGVVLDRRGSPILAGANDQRSPAIAFDGTNFLVVWQQYGSGSYSDIYGARVTPGGVVLDSSGIAISTAANSQWSPTLAFGGTNFLVAWRDGRSGSSSDIYGARVTSGGAVLDPSGIAVSIAADSQKSPALAFDGDNFLVVWQDQRGSSSDIYGTRVTQAGVVMDPSGVPISTAANDQVSPAVASNDTSFLVAWCDARDGSGDIYGARVTQVGVVLDPSGVPISTAANDQVSPAVASDDTSFLVVWAHERSDSSYDIHGARVNLAGAVFDTVPVVIQEGNQRVPALACGLGSQMFLVYQGWAGTVGLRTYNTYRIWGKLWPVPCVEESPKRQTTDYKPAATVVRGLPPGAVVFDAMGRRVTSAKAGVYFVGEGLGASGQGLGRMRKVILQH